MDEPIRIQSLGDLEPGKLYLIDSTGKSDAWKADIAAAWPDGVEAHFVNGLPLIVQDAPQERDAEPIEETH